MSSTMNYPKRPSFESGKSESVNLSVLKNFGVTEFTEQFDYAMVFKTVEGNDGSSSQSAACKTCLNAMLTAGLEVFPYLSVQKDEVYVLIRAPLAKLKEFADNEDYLIRIDEAFLEKTLTEGDAEARIAPIEINDNRNITPYSPYQHIYLEYRNAMNPELYHTPPGEDSPFVKSVRLKLIYNILRASKRAGGCDLEITKLIYKGHILALFPLHDRSITKQLANKCTTVCSMPWDVPTHDLKEYFGEKIALYTVFIGHYSVYLILPSIVGLAFQLVVWGTGNFSHPVLPFYSLLITVWSIYMLEYWKRQEATTAMHWGMSNYERKEQERPEFRGEVVKSHINGEEIVYFPDSKLASLQFFSRTVVVSFMLLVIGVVAAIYVLRFSLQQREETNEYSSTIASILNAVQIQIFNMIYQKVCVFLTDNENHRTDTLYEDSMITKLFTFQFINSYSSFFFLGFIATYLEKANGAAPDNVGQCAAENCMEPMAVNLAIIFGTRLFLNNFLDVLLPYISYRNKYKAETKGVENVVLTPAEKDFLLIPYNGILESISAYADTAIQYGYTMLFITALPIASFCSLLNNWARVKFYLYKLFTFYQRPAPGGAQDIGTWLTIFQFLSVAAVITNAGLICFTMDVLWNVFDLRGRLWIFIGFQWTLLSIQFFATQWIDDVPPEVAIQLERSEFINLKVIEKVADEDYGIVHVIEDEEEMVDQGKSKRGPIHCGNLCGIRCKPERPKMHTVRSRRIRDDLSDFTVFDYPAEPNAGGNWPKPLMKLRPGEKPMSVREQKAAAKAAALENSKYDTGSYVSSVAAVSGPGNYSAVPVPAAPVSPVSPGGYAAVPPQAPGYV